MVKNLQCRYSVSGLFTSTIVLLLLLVSFAAAGQTADSGDLSRADQAISIQQTSNDAICMGRQHDAARGHDRSIHRAAEERTDSLLLTPAARDMKETRKTATDPAAADSYPTSHGRVLGRIDLPTADPIGFAFGTGSTLFYTDWNSRRLVCYDYSLAQIVWQTEYPDIYPSDLAFDGTNLWGLGANLRLLFKFSSADGSVLDTYPLPNSNPSGLEYFQGYLWVADGQDQYITKVLPTDGSIAARIPSPEAGIFGLAWDGRYLWCAQGWGRALIPFDVDRQDWICAVIPGCTDLGFRGMEYKDGLLHVMNWPTPRYITIFQPPGSGEEARTNEGRELVVLRMDTFSNVSDTNAASTDCYMIAPASNVIQDVIALEITPAPLEYIYGPEDNRYARIPFPEIPAGGHFSCYSRTKYREYEVYQVFYPHDAGMLSKIPSDIAKKYLSDHELLCLNDPIVQSCALEAAKGEQNPFWLARNIAYYVADRMDYAGPYLGVTAPQVLEARAGWCREFARVFVALARARGLPAKHVRGDTHSWVEVYMPGPQRWLCIDPPTHIDRNVVARRTRFGSWAWRNGLGPPIQFKGTDLAMRLVRNGELFTSSNHSAEVYMLLPQSMSALRQTLSYAGRNHRYHYVFTEPYYDWNSEAESSPAHTGLLGVEQIDGSSVMLSWDPALTWDNGPVQYEVYVSVDEWNPRALWPHQDLRTTVTAHSCIIHGLSGAIEYYGCVMAKEMNGLRTLPEYPIAKFSLEGQAKARLWYLLEGNPWGRSR